MADTPWLGDACSLVDAFRAASCSPGGARRVARRHRASRRSTPSRHIDPERRRRAQAADVSLPFGGVPIGVKELERVKGWPTRRRRWSSRTRSSRRRRRSAVSTCGRRPRGAHDASEIGFVNYTSTKLNGTTRNPWNPARTPGGSSGGSAAERGRWAGSDRQGGDGGGSIRIPSGLLRPARPEGTYGRIPGVRTPRSAPHCHLRLPGRSVRDSARGSTCATATMPATREPAAVEGWEAGLGSHDLSG